MIKKRTLVLIDGSNFYFKLKDLKLHNLLEFGFLSFARHLAQKDKLVRSIYYVGKIRTDGTERIKKLHSNQQRLFAHLRKNKFYYSLGYLLKSDGKHHEKGVDVNIAVDILVATYEDLCDEIITIC